MSVFLVMNRLVGRMIMWLLPALWEWTRIRCILFADNSEVVSWLKNGGIRILEWLFATVLLPGIIWFSLIIGSVVRRENRKSFMSIRRMIIISLCWPITLKILFVDLSTKKCLIRWKKMKGKSWKKFVPQLSRHFCLIYARSVIIPSIRNDGFVKYRKKS